MSRPTKHPAQQPLPFAEGEAAQDDRRNLLAAALVKIRCDARLSVLLYWIFNFVEKNGDGLTRSYDQLAARPYGLCCELWEAREVVAHAKQIGLVNIHRQADWRGMQRANTYALNWDGIQGILSAGRVAPVPPATQQAACSHESRPPAPIPAGRLLSSQQTACPHESRPAADNCSRLNGSATGSGAGARYSPQNSPITLSSEPSQEFAAIAAGVKGLEVLVEIWNQLPEVGKVERLSKARRQAWSNRLADVHFREHWREALARFPLRCFSEPGGWRPTLDWFLRPDTAGKILEGAFDFAKSGNGRRKSLTGPGQVHPDDLARASKPGAWI